MREETNIWQQQMIIARTRTRERHWEELCFLPTGAPGCGVGFRVIGGRGPNVLEGGDREECERLTNGQAEHDMTWKHTGRYGDY
jgi:hypothetical protein